MTRVSGCAWICTKLTRASLSMIDLGVGMCGSEHERMRPACEGVRVSLNMCGWIRANLSMNVAESDVSPAMSD
eukprot:4430125-Pyramimonas_sp.AAC.1